MMAQQYVQQAARQYRTAQVATADPARLVLMMFDGAIRFASQGREAIEEGDLEAANTYLGRTQDIVAELMASLDYDAGEIAGNLGQLYEFINHRLIEANVKKDTEPLGDAVTMLQELRDVWAQIVEGDGGGSRGADAD